MAKKNEPESSEHPPVPVVDADEAVTPAAVTEPEASNAVRFRFGEITVFKFPDGTSHHVQNRLATITDQTMIANLKQAAKNPLNKIFIAED